MKQIIDGVEKNGNELLATQATLLLALAELVAINADFDVALSTRASQATLLTRATEATSLLILAQLTAINTDLDVALSTRNAEATQLLVLAELIAINTDIDVPLSTRASETTLSALNTKVTLTSGLDIKVSHKPQTNFQSQGINYTNASIATIAANEYVMALSYTVPAGYAFNLIRFSGFAGNTSGLSRLVEKINFGSFNTGTNVFTDSGFSAPVPHFFGILEAEVTTALSATADTLAITYVNQDGVGGRTATAIMPSGAVVGRRIRATLQAGDTGVQDVTAVTDSAATTGVVRIQGINQLSFLRMLVTDQLYTDIFSDESVIVPAQSGRTIDLEFATRTGVLATERYLSTLFKLIPINT